MAGLGSSFQYEESNYIVAESIEEFALASVEAAYEDPGEKAIIVFMTSGAEYHEDRNASHWLDHKRS